MHNKFKTNFYQKNLFKKKKKKKKKNQILINTQYVDYNNTAFEKWVKKYKQNTKKIYP